MLTKKQHELLMFIHDSMKDTDISPSFEEMKEALGLKSKSGIHRLISALVERGYIERLPNRARALRVVCLPEGSDTAAANDSASARSEHNNIGQFTPSPQAETLGIPLYGKIAAGTPIEAIRDEGHTIDIPPSLLGSGQHYALEVNGDSMINAGIQDHDIVIIKKAETCNNGQIVVALVDDNEVTLKRFRRAGSKIILEPENDTHEPRVLDPDRVKVQGHLISLFRQY